MTARQEHTMKESRCYANYHADRQVVMSLALARYNFSTLEIRVLMRHVLGHAISGRTIKRLAKSAGQRIKRGRPRTTPRIRSGDVSDLISATSNGLECFNGSALQLLHQLQVQFGLTPRRYLKWVTQSIRRGRCMMRRCLLCGSPFPSMGTGERHCSSCKSARNRLVKGDEPSGFTTPI